MPEATTPSGRGRLALVSGGAGFIGSHIVDALLANGWRVRVLDDFSSGSKTNLAGVIGRVEILRSDVRNEAAVIAAAEGVDVVFHQAALASVPGNTAP